MDVETLGGEIAKKKGKEKEKEKEKAKEGKRQT